jgi:hypothetical protein
MSDDLKRSQLRAFQYFYIDGTFEFGACLLCLVLAIYFFAETRLQGWLAVVVDSFLVLAMLGGAWLANRLVKHIKETITYPRTGYVTYPRQTGLKRVWRLTIGMAVGGLVAATVAVLVMLPGTHVAAMPLLSGILMGIVLAILGWRMRLPRFYLLAGLSLAAGVALGFSGLGYNLGISVYYLALGLALFATGACVLSTYLHHNPVPEEEK